MAKTNAKDSYSAYREIIKELKAGAFKPCYLLMGEEPVMWINALLHSLECSDRR